MAYTTANAPNLEEWERSYFKEYIRESGFKPYMGTGSNMPFVTKNQLIKGGQVIHIPLIMALRGAGTGTGTLVGNEETMLSKNYDLKPYWHRNAVATTKDEEHNSSIELFRAMREVLKIWDMDDMRDGIINALGSVVEDSSAYDGVGGHPKEVFFADSTTAQKNAFAAANADRLWFGSAESNYSATWATAIATVNDSADVLNALRITDMKAKAKKRQRTKTGSSADIESIRPIRTGDQGREFFMAFTGSGNFKKLKQDTTMTQANREARPRDVESNPLFQDGDLIWDGVVIREIPEIAQTATNIEPVYFCGAQALGFAWGQRPKGTERKEDDYGFIKGVGTESLWSVEKLRFNSRDHGLLTGFFYTG